MKLKEAITVLRRYQDWRRGYDLRSMQDADINPKDVGEALDCVLTHHKAGQPLIVCDKCPELTFNMDMGILECTVKTCVKAKKASG